MTWQDTFKSSSAHLPNAMSIFRGILALFLPFFLLSPHRHYHVIAGMIFILGALTDYWDGWLARRHSIISNAGKILDPSMDKILILVPLATFAWMGFYSMAWVVPIFIREFVVTFCRIGWLLEGKAMGAEKLGKVKFVIQVAALASPFYLLLSRDYSFLAGLNPIFNILQTLLLAAALFLTIISGISFFYVNREHFFTGFFAKYASACGVGLIPFAPGTLGSLFGMGLALLTFWNAGLYALTFLSFFILGYWAVGRLDLSREKDPGYVVVDEVLGMMITLAGVSLNWNSLLAGFILFRLFDIFKPYPCRRLETLPGYWGILLDDVGAGIYARLVMLLLFR